MQNIQKDFSIGHLIPALEDSLEIASGDFF
jgi:hypothetical protein